LQKLWGNDIGKPLTPEEMAAYEKQRAESAKRTAALLGISVDKLSEIEKKARAECEKDTSWEAELDRNNRAKAGIE